MASSSNPQKDYDVFLSFQGEDTRHNFVSHLHKALVNKRIRTFKDDRGLADGDTVSAFTDTREYVERSRVALVVISQSYPTSVWCLNELQTIIRFHNHGLLHVLPVFYKVNISDIKSQSGTFKEPFRKLREKYPDRVQAWTIALSKLTDLFCLHLHDLYTILDLHFDISMRSFTHCFMIVCFIHHRSDEGAMVEEITTQVQAMLSDLDTPSSKSLTLTDPLTTKFSELLGLDRHMKALYKLLDLNKSEVRLIGIWGPGGAGKTTLARFAYEHLYNNFQTHMFVDNAENIYYQDPVMSSEETLTSGNQDRTRNKTREQQVSTTVIKSTVGHRKSLLVIDCVDNLEQLKIVAEIAGWCGSGSRVILITPDTKLLDHFGLAHIYEVKFLRYDEALQLFSTSAFESEYPPASFESLSLRAVQIACFLPLALKILGSFLKDKNEEEWEKELQKLEGDREKKIMEIMKKTYKTKDDKDQIPVRI